MLQLKSITLASAILLTGLSAGLFYAWTVSVIPGTKLVTDKVYLESMQSINRAILNPWFFLSFFGALIGLAAASFSQYSAGVDLRFWLVLTAFMVYMLGTFGVTGLGNVPLNNELEALNLLELSDIELSEFRTYYEVNWNRLHWIRTGFAILSFLMVTVAVLYE